MNINISDLQQPNKEYGNKEHLNKEYIKSTMKCDTVYSHLIDDLGIIDQEKIIIDHNIVKTHFENLGRLSSKQAMKILYDAMEILKNESNIIEIDKPSYVLGDIHGQYFDLINILSRIDLNKDTLVLLGDYVDRGYYSTEVYFYLLLLKCHFPKNIYLLRGNHESKIMTNKFTFKSECLDKYDLKIYELCLESFMTLPLAALIQKNVFCVHGGISKEAPTLKDINDLNRFCELKIEGAICDLLWSDPNPDFENGNSFVFNERRNCSYLYNYSDVLQFLKINNLKCILRGHEVAREGYCFYKPYGDTPSVITLFSAPNYCELYKNKGAILKVDNGAFEIKTFKATTRPFILPNNMDGINWSFAFIGEKIAEFYIDLLKNIDFSNTEPENLDLEANKIEIEMIKAQNCVVALTLIRAERENMSEMNFDFVETISMNTIRNPTLQEYPYEEVSNYDEPNLSLPKEKLTDKGVSMSISESLKPTISKEAEEKSITEIIHNSVIEIDTTTDNATVNIKEKKQGERSYLSWCFY